MRKLIALLIAMASPAACSGSSTQSSNPIPIDQVPGELAASICAAVQACNPFYYGIAFSNTDCAQTLEKQLQEASYTDIERAVSAGTVKYDGDLARTCAKAISSGACSALDNNLPDPCQKTFVGTVDMGGDCTIDQECVGLGRCDVSAGTCPGKCALRASAGIACSKDEDCTLGLVCSAITSRCVAPAAVGEPCDGGVAGKCAAGLICVGGDDASKKPGSCMTASTTLTQKAGDTCDLLKGPWCVNGSSCVVESVTLMPTTLNSKCQALVGAGATCGLGIPSQCPVGQYCPLQFLDLATGTATASCTALPAEAEACGPKVEDRCAANLVCDTTTNPAKPVCVTPHELGQLCSDPSLCYSKNCVSRACIPASPCAK